MLEIVLIIISKDGAIKSYTPTFCRLLKARWHELHEDIVSLLDEIKDPDSVEFIYDVSAYIPHWDDGRSLARKCIWALASINTALANSKIQLLANSEDPIIKEAAELQLRGKKLK